MNRLIRMTYGRSGTRLEGILVSSSHVESAADPRWLTCLLLVVFIAVPLLVSRFAIQNVSHQPTVIDVSHLTEKPPLPVQSPVVPEKPKVEPIVRPLPPPKNPEPPPPRPAQQVQKPVEQPKVAPVPEKPKQVAISRPAPRGFDNASYQPKAVRERLPVSAEAGSAPGAARVRRDAAAREIPSAGAAITRARGAVAVDLPGVTGRVGAVRRQPGGDVLSQGGGTGPRLVARTGHPSGTAEGSGAPRLVAVRERGKATGSGDGEGTATLGLARGISLSSLEICSSPQAEEDDIRAVLRVVGSRQSCSDGKGEFQFKGTQRVSSFNLMIFPAKGRKPANRCEELENAYRCLKNR